jgi:hypothetical protein
MFDATSGRFPISTPKLFENDGALGDEEDLMTGEEWTLPAGECFFEARLPPEEAMASLSFGVWAPFPL